MSGIELAGTRAAVANTHWLATSTATSVLDRGGNAFDAVVAGAFVLVVAEQDQCGLGGEVQILLRTSADERVRVICGQRPMPVAATPSAFAALGVSLIPGSVLLPACVPHAFDAWMLLLAEFGTWSVRDVLSDAIAYAHDGVPVSAGLSRRIRLVEQHFLAHWPSSASVYLRAGIPRPATRLRNPALASTLQRLAAEAGLRWLERTRVTDLEGRTERALLDRSDWTSRSASIEEPVSGRFRDCAVHKPGPWSQGLVLLQALGILQALGEYDAHALIEALKVALADREARYGDPNFVGVPLASLISDAYARDRATVIGSTASHALTPGSPDGRAPRLPSHVGFEVSVLAIAAAGDTSHIDVVDRHGNVVSAAPSGSWLQSSPVIPELGFPLGTRGQMLWLEDRLASSLRPGTRPCTTLSPSIVVCDDGSVIGCGSPGGDGQDQWTLQFLVHHLVNGLGMQASADHPTYQSLHMPLSFWPRRARPGVVQLESSWDEPVVHDLRERGHPVEQVPERSQGWICAVQRQPDGMVSAAASARGRNCTAQVS